VPFDFRVVDFFDGEDCMQQLAGIRDDKKLGQVGRQVAHFDLRANELLGRFVFRAEQLDGGGICDAALLPVHEVELKLFSRDAPYFFVIAHEPFLGRAFDRRVRLVCIFLGQECSQ